MTQATTESDRLASLLAERLPKGENLSRADVLAMAVGGSIGLAADAALASVGFLTPLVGMTGGATIALALKDGAARILTIATARAQALKNARQLVVKLEGSGLKDEAALLGEEIQDCEDEIISATDLAASTLAMRQALRAKRAQKIKSEPHQPAAIGRVLEG